VKKFSDICERTEDWFALFSGGIAFVIMALTIVDVVGRYFFLKPLTENVELSMLLMVGVVMFSIAGTQRVGGHVAMEIFVNRFKRMNRPLFPAFKTFALLLSEAVFLFALYYVIRAFLESYNIHEVTSGPVFMIIWPAKLIICFGVFLMCVRLAIQLIQTVRSIGVWRKVE
jgi:C4-dicarboxylate transporter DctQ subunit